jgi:chromate transporter
LMHGVRGGIVAGVCFILPSVFVLLALSFIYAQYGHVAEISGILDGIKAVVVAIVVEAVWKMGKRALVRPWHVVLALISFLAIYFGHVPFPLIVLGAALIGWGMATGQPLPVPAENEAVPSGARAFLGKTAATFLTCFSLWLVPFCSVLFTLGWRSLPMKLYLFFSQAAFVTFGGAYAVLAYVNQDAVATYGWITAQQAMDGFGLAETTPGPLIMVLQFIGFMAGWNHAAGLDPAWHGVLCALLTTFATFLPSFFFIFAFAPMMERFETNRNLKAALAGVTAAVVGVIFTLVLTFGCTVIFPMSQVDWFALAVGAVSLVVIFRWKIDALWIVLGGGVLGLLRVWWGM